MKVMIVGATSALAHETAKLYAKEGAELFLVGRNAAKVTAVCQDLQVRGAKRVETYILDLAQTDQHEAMVNNAVATLGKLDAVLIAHGTLSDQEACQQSVEKTLDDINNNALSIISLLTILANYFEKQKDGTIAVISSVAGDRGRQSNYVYGASKALINTFMSGLRNRLYKSGVKVVNIKPGTVDTPMTAHLKKGLLFASAPKVGADIYEAMLKGKDVVYTPFFWRFIMLILIHVPEFVFKRLNLKS
jgi:decaprenylphospho-beta-D-erythro-pentofuranosid-2-ulose 2-reductase